MVGLIVLREPIISLLFQRGAFDAISMRLTAGALLYYGIGLWAFSAVRIVLNTFYALQETATPVRIGLVAIASNTVLSVLLIRPMQHEGLALALSLSSMLNLGLLVMALRKRLGSLGWRKIAASTRRSLLCSGAMGMVVWGLARYLIPLPIRGNWLQLLGGVTACIIAGCLIYTGLAYIFRAPELHVVLQMVLRKKKS
jgi:putative peptidoglycan lipid II flippase